jgi:hypothetical protein
MPLTRDQQRLVSDIHRIDRTEGAGLLSKYWDIHFERGFHWYRSRGQHRKNAMIERREALRGKQKHA